MSDNVVIKIENVSKSFKLPHQKAGSIKHLVTNPLRGKRTYEMQHALKNIDLEIKKGEFFGIVGRNGSGKSTLLKILAGIYQPSTGTVQVKGKLVPFIELGVGFNPELTGRENVYLNGALLGFSEKEIAGMYNDIVEFAELEKFMDQKLKNYSSGMQVRLAFSMATRARADILLIDEVLAVGDADFQRKCFNYFKQLKKQNTTVIFISHDMEAVREFCDRAALIDDAHILSRGSAQNISEKYSQLFIDSTKKTVKRKGLRNGRKGEGQVTIERVSVSNDQLSSEDTEISVKVKIKAQQNIDEVVSGFRVCDSSGQAIFGTNSKIERVSIAPMKAGETRSIIWSFPNIFSDGTFTLTLSLHASDGVTIYDFFPDAAIFTVRRAKHLPYKIYPDIKLKLG